MIRNLLLTTFLSIRAHKMRVFLTMIGIIIGISSVVAISTLGEGMKREIIKTTTQNMKSDELKLRYQPNNDESNEGHLNEEDEFSFSRLDMKKVRDISGVKAISPVFNQGRGGDVIDGEYNYFGEQGYGPIMANTGENHVIYGRDFSAEDSERDVILIRENLIKEQWQSVVTAKELVNRAISINGSMFKVIGILPEFDYSNTSATTDWNLEQSSFVPKKVFNDMTKSKPVHTIQFKLAEKVNREEVVSEANNILKEVHPERNGTFDEDKQDKEMMASIQKNISEVTMFLMAITAISLLVGGIGVMNIMYVSVAERKREIGIRRAIGAKPRMILWQFLLEASFITLIGGLIGVLLGYGLSALIGHFIDVQPVMTMSIFLVSTSVSTATGLLFGIIPAFSAARMDPIKAIYQ